MRGTFAGDQLGITGHHVEYTSENERLEPKSHPTQKENDLPSTFIFGFQPFIFQFSVLVATICRITSGNEKLS